ncbi:OsmC family protein [Hydrogenivirga sp.]
MEEKRAILKLSREGTYVSEMPSGSIEVGEQGLKPMELLLTALGGCSGADVYTILNKKRQQVEDIEIEVRGFRRDKHPRIYERIELLFRIKGNVEPKAVEQAVRLSVEKYCSVYAMLKGSVNVEVNYEICRD